jgi:hypothetical protein
MRNGSHFSYRRLANRVHPTQTKDSEKNDKEVKNHCLMDEKINPFKVYRND